MQIHLSIHSIYELSIYIFPLIAAIVGGNCHRSPWRGIGSLEGWQWGGERERIA